MFELFLRNIFRRKKFPILGVITETTLNCTKIGTGSFVNDQLLWEKRGD